MDGGEQRGESLLARISTEMVRAQKQYFGKGPTNAKSYMFDDLLFVVMRGGMTTAEKTMLDLEQADAVRDFRQKFENEIGERLTSMVEELTGRKVVTYQSQVMFKPDVIVEMFVFDEPAPHAALAATAEGQLSEGQVGEATADDADEPPATSGQ